MEMKFDTGGGKMTMMKRYEKPLPMPMDVLGDDLWKKFVRRRIKGLDSRTHTRFRRRPLIVVLVVCRAKPKEGYEVGNFSVDCKALNYILTQRKRYGGLAIVALIEQFNIGRPLNAVWAEDLAHTLRGIEPSIWPDSGLPYHWVDDSFYPLGMPKTSKTTEEEEDWWDDATDDYVPDDDEDDDES